MANEIQIQTFTPTLEEFRNFPRYIEYMESKGAHLAGVARVIPPAGWCPRKQSYETDDVLSFKIQSPIDQKAYGKQGVFTIYNISRWKTMDVRKFKEMSETKKYKAPVEDYDELERKYWKSLSLNNNSPIYGADTPGSFYDPDVDEWNITRLGTILSDVMNQKIEGVNTAYLYFGMWRSTFCWHTEDMDLYSINYLHHGDPKFWYAIPPEHGERFERMAASFFSSAANQCRAFLRHKMFLISPFVLKNYSIPVNRVVQSEGQFIVTFPRGYHAGFNLGYNIAESTNFASMRWIDYGKTASLCLCKTDSVRLDMDRFVYAYQRDQYDDWVASQQKAANHAHFAAAGETASGTSSVVSKRHPIMGVKRKKTKKTSATTKRIALQSSSSDSESVDSLCSDEEDCKAAVDRALTAVKELCQDMKPNSCTAAANSGGGSEWDLSDPYKFGSWSKPLVNLWQFKMCNLNAEIEYNRTQALNEPHCCLCQYFVPKALARRADRVPEKSRRILTDLCFIRNNDEPRFSLPNPGDAGEEDQLLTCRDCHVTIHAKCYGVRLDDTHDTKEWECERCRLNSSTAECQLCCLRGGIMRLTADTEWVHVICALFCPGTKFTNFHSQSASQQQQHVVLKRRKESELARQDSCIYCKSNNGQPAMCGSVHDQCPNVFHVTCGYQAGASFEIRDWPTMVQAVCSQHNGADDSSETGKRQFNDNDWVFTKRGDSYIKGRICGSQLETFCVIDFDDGSYSNNVYVDDLVECSCHMFCEKAHVAGARVKIYWMADKKFYGAIFRRAYQVMTYNVRLENGDVDRCTQDELISCDNGHLPSEISSKKKIKFTKAEKKYGSNNISQSAS